MQLRILAQQLDLEAPARRAIERRIRLTLGRHAAEIERVQVTLSPGEPGARCRIRVRLRPGELLSIEDAATDPPAAAATAAWRLEHRLEHRRRGLRRVRTDALPTLRQGQGGSA